MTRMSGGSTPMVAHSPSTRLSARASSSSSPGRAPSGAHARSRWRRATPSATPASPPPTPATTPTMSSRRRCTRTSATTTNTTSPGTDRDEQGAPAVVMELAAVTPRARAARGRHGLGVAPPPRGAVWHAPVARAAPRRPRRSRLPPRFGAPERGRPRHRLRRGPGRPPPPEPRPDPPRRRPPEPPPPPPATARPAARPPRPPARPRPPPDRRPPPGLRRARVRPQRRDPSPPGRALGRPARPRAASARRGARGWRGVGHAHPKCTAPGPAPGGRRSVRAGPGHDALVDLDVAPRHLGHRPLLGVGERRRRARPGRTAPCPWRRRRPRSRRARARAPTSPGGTSTPWPPPPRAYPGRSLATTAARAAMASSSTTPKDSPRSAGAHRTWAPAQARRELVVVEPAQPHEPRRRGGDVGAAPRCRGPPPPPTPSARWPGSIRAKASSRTPRPLRSSWRPTNRTVGPAVGYGRRGGEALDVDAVADDLVVPPERVARRGLASADTAQRAASRPARATRHGTEQPVADARPGPVERPHLGRSHATRQP